MSVRRRAGREVGTLPRGWMYNRGRQEAKTEILAKNKRERQTIPDAAGFAVRHTELHKLAACRKGRRDQMNRILLVVTDVVLAVLVSGVLLAQSTPFVGTWKQNIAKSKYSPGPVPQS